MLRGLTKPFGRLGWRLVLAFVTLVGASLTLISLLLVFTLDTYFMRQEMDDLHMRAQIVATNVAAQPQGYGGVALAASQQLQVRVRVLDAGKHILYDSYQQDPPASAPADLQPDPAVRVTAPVTYGKAHILIGYVVLSRPLTFRQATLSTIRTDLLQLGAITLLIAIVAGLVLGRSMTAPLMRLTRAAERLASGDLAVTIPSAGTDEIGNLSRGFNVMAEQLQQSFSLLATERDHLRAFVADVSHELRTPITALRAFNDLLLQGAHDDPIVRREFLQESADQIDRIDWLTQNLLDLSRLESGLTTLQIDDHDLRGSVRHVVTTYRPAAERRSIDLTLEVPETECLVPHDPRFFHQALANVLDNAIKFTPRGGEILVRMLLSQPDDGIAPAHSLAQSQGTQWACVTVRDNGPGIAGRDLPHVFERFYRGTELTVGSNGSGLGLAIVKQIMESHNGDVEIRSVPGQGTWVILSLPLTCGDE